MLALLLSRRFAPTTGITTTTFLVVNGGDAVFNGVDRVVHSGDAPPAIANFGEWLTTTDGGAGPDRYWPMADLSGTTMVASAGGLSGNYESVELDIQDASGGKHVGFDGVSSRVIINRPVATSAFTIMWRVQLDVAAPAFTLAATEFSNVPGQYIFNLVTDGAGGMKPRVSSMDASGNQVQFTGSANGTIPIGRLFHIFLMRVANGTMEVWVHDIQAGTVAQIALTLTAGTPPASWAVAPAGNAHFGATASGFQRFDGVASHLVVWNTDIPRSDIQALLQVQPAPPPLVVWAKALDAGTVAESASASGIAVAPHVHPATGFALAVVDATGTSGTLSAVGTTLTYAANAVSGNQLDTGTSWRISKDGVNSPTVAFSITVTETGAALYRQQELDLVPLSLWGLGEDTGTVLGDAVGGRNGTYTGTIAYGAADLPSNSTDGAIDFLGTGFGQIPHSAALALSAFTLSFWFRPKHIPIEGEPAFPLFTKTSADGVPGGLSCHLASNEGDILRVRFRDAANAPQEINTPSATIEVNTRYHVCIRANNTGFDLHINGVFVAKNTAHTTGWSVNTQPIQIAAGPGFAATANCLIDEICLFSRFLTVAEVLILAQQSGIAPVAVADSATITESTTETIDVLANDRYVGIPTIQLMALPPSPDIVTVVAAANTLPFLTYAAGAVGATTTRSFSYRLIDANGTSNTVSCPVTIQDTGFTATSIANCYVHSAADTVTVTTMAALAQALDAAPAGRQILISAAGSPYTGGTFTFDPRGTEAAPIVVRPVGARGTVVINNATWTLAPTSARCVFTNLHFNNAEISVNGAHHRIARCQFRDLRRYAVEVYTATDTRISHCDFSQYTNEPGSNVKRGCVRFDNPSIVNLALQRGLVDYCYIHDIRHDVDIAGTNPINLATGAGGGPDRKPGLTVDHCLFDDIGRIDSNEVIMIKTSECTISFCTFVNMAVAGGPGNGYSAQYIQQRQGRGIEVRSCWFENMAGIPLIIHDKYSVPPPVRDPLIIGNVLRGGHNMRIGCGDHPRDLTGNPKPGPYWACREGRFIGNQLQSGHIQVGTMGISAPVLSDAEDNNIVLTGPRANTRLDGAPVYTLHNQVRTTFNDDTGAGSAFVLAERMIAGDVGLGAADPLCPTGPQS